MKGGIVQRDLGQAFPTAVLVGHRWGRGRPGGDPLALGEGPVEESLVCRPGLITEPGPSCTVNRESLRVLEQWRCQTPGGEEGVGLHNSVP